MHDHRSGNEHSHRHPPVYGKTQFPFFKYIRNVPHGFQIYDPVQCIYRCPGLYVVSLPHFYNPICFRAFIRLFQKDTVRFEAIAHIQHIFLLIGNPKKTAGAMPTRFQIGSNLLHRMVM